MKRKDANLEIMNKLSEYLSKNPDQRFGQALRNTGVVVDFIFQQVDPPIYEVQWTNHFNEEPDSMLKRMIETENKRKG